MIFFKIDYHYILYNKVIKFRPFSSSPELHERAFDSFSEFIHFNSILAIHYHYIVLPRFIRHARQGEVIR